MGYGGLPLATFGVGKKMEDAAIKRDRRERELLAQQQAAAAAAEDAARANVERMFGQMMQGPMRNFGKSRATDETLVQPAVEPGPGGVGGPEEPQGPPASAQRKPLNQMSEQEQQEYFRYLQLKAKVEASRQAPPQAPQPFSAARDNSSAIAAMTRGAPPAAPAPASGDAPRGYKKIMTPGGTGYMRLGPTMLPEERAQLAADNQRRDMYEASKAVVFGPGGEAVSVNSFGDPLIGPVDKDIGKGIVTLPARVERGVVAGAEAMANLPSDTINSFGQESAKPIDRGMALRNANRMPQLMERADQPAAQFKPVPRFDFGGAKIPIAPELDSVTGGLEEGLAQFLFSRKLVGMAAPGGGIVPQLGKDATATFVGIDGKTGRLADIVPSDAVPAGPLREFLNVLKTEPNDSPLVGRFKNLLEDMTVSGATVAPLPVARAGVELVTPKKTVPPGSAAAAGGPAGPMGPPPGPPPAASAPAVAPQPSSLKQAANVLAATVLPGTTIRPQAFKAIERILIESGVPRDRVTAGINRIAQSVPSLTGRPPTVTQLLQREFGPEFPQVEYNLNLVARERGFAAEPGDASSSIVHNTAKDMRQSQGDFLNESAERNLGTTPVLPEIERLQNTQVPRITTAANRNFGTQARLGSREQIAENLRQMGREGYEPILRQPIDGTRQDDILYTLHGPQMGELMRPMRQIAAGEGLNLDQFIEQQPLRAAHWMQHKARLLAEANETNTPLRIAYTNMRNRILLSLDDLQAPDGRTYQQLRHDYGDEADIENALNAGDRFAAAVRNPEGMDTFIQRFNGMTPSQRQGGLASIRDWVFARLRGGQEDAPARIGELTQRGVLDALDRLGPEGQAFANELRAIRNENKALETIKSAGTSFSQLVQSPEQLTQTLNSFRQLSPQQQSLFLGNVRDWVQGRLRGGREDAPARVGYLAQIGVLDALDQLTPDAKRLADDIRAIRDENQFLSAITNKNANGSDQSATFTNQTAAAEAPGLYSRRGVLPRSAGAVMTDMATMGVGMSNAPVFTAAKTAQKLYKGWQLPRKRTREDMTRLLMARPTPGQAPVAPSASPVGPSGAGGSGSLPLMGGSAASVPQPVQPAMPIGAQPVAPRSTMAVGAPQRQRVSRPEPTEPEWTGAKPNKPQSILAWIRSQGGIMDRNYMTGDTKQALGGRSQAYPGLINNQSGKGLDDLVSAAYHEGFDVNPDDANSLMRLIEEELAGNPSYRIGQKEEWDVYQEFLNSKDRGTRLETPPELGGAMLGGVIGATVPADFNHDGEVTEDERAKALGLGIVGGGVAGKISRHVEIDPTRTNAFVPEFRSSQPWQKAMAKAAIDQSDIELATRYMRDRSAGKSSEQIAERIGVPADSLAGRIQDIQARLDNAGIGVELQTARIAPELIKARKPADMAPPVRADQLSSKDLILGYNDGDPVLQIGLDLDVPDSSNIAGVVRSRLHKLRTRAKAAKASGNLYSLSREWGVTTDEIEKLIAKRPQQNAGGYQQSVERIVDVMEKAAKTGNPMRLIDVAQRLNLKPGSVAAMLSQARNGAKPLPPELVARVKSLKIGRGAPIELAQSPPEVGGTLLGGVIGAGMAGDNDEDRLKFMAIGAGGGALAGRLSRGKKLDPTSHGSFGANVSRGAGGEAPKLPNLIEDATDENLLKMQLDMIGKGEVPPVFKLFKLRNGRVIAWNGDEARGGVNHAQAREILGLGNQRAEHGQIYLGGPKLSQTNWYDVTGEGEAPRSIERMVKEGQRQGRNPGDVLGDAYPYEAERDLRSIGAMGPGNTLADYPHRRSLALSGTTKTDGGHTVVWKTPSGAEAKVTFTPGGLPDQEIVQFRLEGRTSNLEGKNTVPISQAREAFDKATGILEREVIARDKNVYVFDGSIPQNTRRYAQSLQRLGAPQGYVAVLDRQYGNFAFIKQSRFDADVKSGRIDPKDWTIIPSKRGSKEVPEWRRVTGQYALPVGAAGTMAALATQQRTDEPRPN